MRAEGGTLSSVQVSSPGPGKVRGSWSKDKSTWTSTTTLAPGATYTVNAGGTGSDGKKLFKAVTFTTEAAKNSFVGEYYPDKGTTVGVATPMSITFNKPIHNKPAVEKKRSVTASPAVQGAWSWMKDRNGKDRIDYRPPGLLEDRHQGHSAHEPGRRSGTPPVLVAFLLLTPP